MAKIYVWGQAPAVSTLFRLVCESMASNEYYTTLAGT